MQTKCVDLLVGVYPNNPGNQFQCNMCAVVFAFLRCWLFGASLSSQFGCATFCSSYLRLLCAHTRAHTSMRTETNKTNGKHMHSAQRINLYEIRESENAFRKSLEKFPHFIFTVRRVDVHAFHGRPAAFAAASGARARSQSERAISRIMQESRFSSTVLSLPAATHANLCSSQTGIVDSANALKSQNVGTHTHTALNGLANASLPVERQSEHTSNGIRLLWKWEMYSSERCKHTYVCAKVRLLLPHSIKMYANCLRSSCHVFYMVSGSLCEYIRLVNSLHMHTYHARKVPCSYTGCAGNFALGTGWTDCGEKTEKFII